MNNYCEKCGTPLSVGDKFCTNCGQPVNTKNEMQNIAAANIKEPVIENVNKNSPTGNAKQKDGGFIAMLVNEVKDLLRHPKKLIPSIVLSIIWMVLSILYNNGSNIPALRFLYALSYSNGGMFGGFFGAVGGIFGKAMFATVINTIVLSLFAKKNPFANVAKSLKGIFGKAAFSGLSAISPFLIGAGSGLILYWLFNITSSTTNCAVAVVGAIGAFSAIGKKNGILTSLVYTVTGKLTKGKFPSQVTVNRTITGFSAGFALGLPLTFVQFGWLLFLIGAIILATGIAFAVVGKNGIKKISATVALFVFMSAMLLPMFCTNVFAAGVKQTKDSITIEAERRGDDEVYGFADYIEQAFYNAGTITLTPDGNGYTFTLPSHTGSFVEHVIGEPSFPTYRITYTIPELTFYVSAFEPNDKGGYIAHVTTGSGMGIAVNEVFSHEDGDWSNWEEVDYGVNYTLNQISFDLSNTAKTLSMTPDTVSTHDVVLDVTGRTRWEYNAVVPYIGSFVIYFHLDGLTFANVPVIGSGETEEPEDDYENEEEEEEEVKPYRGRLTYTNGEVNKYGQPFPDIMDFDGDGEISWDDYYIRKQLSHDPDWLDRPESKAVGAAIAVLTALLGAAGGALGGPLGSVLGSAAQAAASAAQGAFSGVPDGTNEPEQKEDLGRYIRRDPDGDLYVKDPVTGKETLYIKQDDGSYRNTVSDQNYTVGEIKNMVSHVEENSGYYSDISKKQQKAVEYQHEHASDFSETSVKLAEQIRQQEEQDAKEDAIYKLGYKHGVYNGDEDAIRERLAEKQAVAVSLNEDYHRVAANIDTAVKVAEGTKKVADVAADVVGTVDKTGIFKDVYSATTAAAGNAGEVMAGNMTAAEAVAKTAVDASTEIIKNRASSTGAKFAANILGDSAQDATSAMLEGKNLGEVTNAAIEGAGRGLLDSTVDYAVSTGNKFAASTDKTSLTDAGETLASDLAKSALPKVEVPKKKKQ